MKLILNLSLLILLPMFSSYAVGDYKAGQDKSQVCASCHGVDGNSQISMYPRLAGQHKDYLEYALKGYRSGDRKNAIMSGFANALSDQDIEDLSEYYSKQKGLNTLPKK